MTAPIFSSHGLALVPKEATGAMTVAYADNPSDMGITDYEAMLAARPPHCSEVEKAVEAVIEAAKEVNEWATVDEHGRYSIGPGKFDPFAAALRALEAKWEGK